MSLVCLCLISHCRLSSVTFHGQMETIVLLSFLIFISTFALSSFYLILSCALPPYRTKLDLGIVKKSIVVDDVSQVFSCQSQFLSATFWCLVFFKCLSVSPVVHFERHSVRTGSFQAGVVVLAAEHWSTRAGLNDSFLLIYYSKVTPDYNRYVCSIHGMLTLLFIRKTTYLQFSSRPWGGMKASPARLVIHLLQPFWLCIWTRLRHFLWVKYLYPLWLCSCLARSGFLCVWFKWGRTVTATCHDIPQSCSTGL